MTQITNMSNEQLEKARTDAHKDAKLGVDGALARFEEINKEIHHRLVESIKIRNQIKKKKSRNQP